MKTIGTFFLLISFQLANAQDHRFNSPSRTGRSSLSSNPQVQSTMDIPIVPKAPETIDNIEDLIEYHQNQLLNNDSNVNPINFPAFPRIWATRYANKPMDVDVNLGPTLAGNGVRATFSYKYNVKTTLWLISSTRPQPGFQGPENISSRNYGFNRESDLIVDGPVPAMAYANVRKGYPVVALCIYEINMSVATGSKLGLEYWLGGGGISKTNEQGGGFSTWSNFFNAERDVPIEKYLNTDCGEYFEGHVKNYTERNFGRIGLDLLSQYDPRNKCSIRDVKTPAGDNSCMAWHSKHMKKVRSQTVPRCEMFEGESRCVLKYKRKNECSLWTDNNNRLVDSNPEYNLKSATRGIVKRSCDYGLTCRMIDETPRTAIEKLKQKIGFRPRAACE